MVDRGDKLPRILKQQDLEDLEQSPGITDSFLKHLEVWIERRSSTHDSTRLGFSKELLLAGFEMIHCGISGVAIIEEISREPNTEDFSGDSDDEDEQSSDDNIPEDLVTALARILTLITVHIVFKSKLYYREMQKITLDCYN